MTHATLSGRDMSWRARAAAVFGDSAHHQPRAVRTAATVPGVQDRMELDVDLQLTLMSGCS
jgi:hypothetical protein